MPSWNIHIAHAEELLRTDGPEALGIRCVDAFLLGNVLPDVYVGHIVQPITHKIAYRETHFAGPEAVPEPRYWEFFELFGQPTQGEVDDLVLGAWAHLVADHDYNLQNNRYIEAHGIAPGVRTRERKQADFDLFGRTLDISLVPQISDEVLAQCARFPQYELLEPDIRGAEAAITRIVADNAARHVYGTPTYDMLDEAFFASTFDAVTKHIRNGLTAYAAGDPAWGARR